MTLAGERVLIVGARSSTAVGQRRVWDSGQVTHVAQTTEDGGQLLSIFEKNRGVERVRYVFPGRDLQLLPDGSVAIVDLSGEGELVSLIETPWAKDAAGAPVATHYEVRGATLTQVITPSASTQYPVIADPTVKWYRWGAQIRFSRSETNRIGSGTTACAIVTRPIPTVGAAISAACAGLSAFAYAGLAINKCVAVNWLYTPRGFVTPWYWGC